MKKDKRRQDIHFHGENDRRWHPETVHSDRSVKRSGRNSPLDPAFKVARKANPGILDWIVDAKKGLFSPLRSILLSAIDPTGLLPDLWARKEEALAVKRYLREGLKSFGSPPAPYTPDGVYAERLKSATAEQDQMKSIVGIATFLEGIPFIDAGTTFLRLYQCPKYASAVRRALEVFYSEFQVGELPYIQRYWNQTYTPLLPGVSDLAVACSKKLIDPKAYHAAAAEKGLSETWAEMLVENQFTAPSPRDALEMLRREKIDEETFRIFGRRRQYTEYQIDRWLDLKRPLYPIPDLIRMLVREAFIPEMITPAPDLFTEYIKQYGYEKIDADRWWTAHWFRMDPRDAAKYFLWWNDLPEEFEDWMIVADLHPGDRKKLRTVSYTPPGVRELGYGYDMGVYTRADIVDARRRAGRSPDDAEKCADALIAYRVFAEAEAVRREWLYLVAMGRRTLEEFQAKLVELKTSPEAIRLWLERAELEIERRLKPEMDVEGRVITSSEALWAFEYGLRDESWTRAALTELDWTPERMDLAIERSKKRMEMRVKPPKEVTYRTLTTTQIRDLYRFRKLTPDALPAAVEGIGYSPEDAAKLAQILLDLEAKEAAEEEEELLKAQERDRDALIKFIYTTLRDENRSLYVEGFRTRGEIEANYLAMEMPAEIAEVYLAEADLRAELDHKKELAMLYKDAFKKELLSEPELLAMLLSIPMREDVAQREYFRARVAKRPEVPLITMMAEYPAVLEAARRLMEEWKAG